MATYSAGTAGVDIEPNFSGFVAKLRSDLARADVDYSVTVNPDASRFRESLESELASSSTAVAVAVRPDVAAFDSELNDFLSTLNPTLDVEVSPNLTGFIEQLQTQLAAIDLSGITDQLQDQLSVSAGPIGEGPVSIDTATASAQLDELTRRRTIEIGIDVDWLPVLFAMGTLLALRRLVTIEIGLDTSDLIQIDAALANVARTREAKINAEVDQSSAATARAELDLIAQNRQVQLNVDSAALAGLTALGSHTVNLDVQIDQGALSTVNAQLDLLARDRVVTYHPEIDQASAATTEELLDRIARRREIEYGLNLNATEAARIELLLGLLGRDRQVNLDVNGEGALAGLRSQSDSASRSLTQLSSIRFAGLASGIGAIIPVLLGAAGAAGGLVSILGGLIGVAAVGGNGIGDAFKAASEATAGASAAAEQHEDDLYAVADAQQSVIDAQHNEMDALRSVEDAQKNLTQAKKDAKDAQDNLNLAVKNGALSQESAELAYRRAVVNLQKTRQQAAQGKASQLDVDQAEFDVRQAGQNITNVKVKNSQTKADADDANAKGIDGSDQVQAAQRQLESAQYSAQQAAIATTKAIRDLAQAQEDAAKSGSAAAGGTDKYAQAMAKLAPSAQDFVTQMRALGPQWTELRKAVQENLFSGLGDTVTQFANNQLGAFQNGMTQIASSMNGAIKSTLTGLDTLFSELTANGTMQAFVDGIGQALNGMAPMITAFANAFIQMGAIIGPELTPLFTALAGAINQMAVPLANLGATFLQTLTPLIPTIANLVTVFADALQPVLPVIGTLFQAIGDAIIPLAGPLSRIAQIVGTALAQAITAIAPSLPTIANAFADVLTAVAPLIEPLAQIFAVIAGAIAQNISSLALAMQPVVVAFAEGLKPVIPVLAQAFQQLSPVLAQVAQTMGQAMAEAMVKIAPMLPQLVQAFVDLVIAVVPILPALAQLAAELLPILADILIKVAPLLVGLVEKFTSLANMVVSYVVPAIHELKDAMTSAWESIKGAWDAMEQRLDQLRDKFEQIVRKIKDTWKQLVDTFKEGGIGGVAGKVVDKALSLVVPGRAAGGPISGPGTSTSDSILARLSDGEFIVNAASTEKYRGLVEAINSDSLPGFANGGIAGDRATAWASSHDGEPYIYGGLDCSGYLSGVFNQLTGQNARFTTDSDFSEYGMVQGSDPNGFTIGTDGGTGENGHMAGNLLGTNLESDGSNGIQFGGAADGPSAFPFVWSLPRNLWNPPAPADAAPAPSAPATEADASDPSNYSNGTYIGPSSVDTSKDTQGAGSDGLPEEYSLQGIFSKAGGILATGLLSMVGLENSVLSSSNTYNKAVNTAVDFYANKNKGTENSTTTTDNGDPGAAPQAPVDPPAPEEPPAPQRHVYDPQLGAEQWRGTVVTVLQGTGRDLGLADRTVAQINIESGGDPGAVNDYDINAQNGTPSIGLLQVIKPTFDAYMDGRFPGGQSDPEANIGAALNYTDDRYSGPENIWPTTAGYATGGWVFGRGTGTSDSNLARLSDGEFVVNADAAARNGALLESINSGGFAAPSLPAGFAARGGDTSSATYDRSINFGSVSTLNVDDLMREQDRWNALQTQGEMAALP